MTEQEKFLSTWQREFATTMKILRQMPENKADFKPDAEKTKSARDLAAVFIDELGVVEGIVKGKIEFGHPRPSFVKYGDLLHAHEVKFNEMFAKVKGMSEADWNSTISFPIGPKQMGDVRRGDVLWMMLYDGIHHRGQFSIYLRLVGAKVPSIYGPSGDEPWM